VQHLRLVNARLEFISGSKLGTTVPLEERDFTIGRKPQHSCAFPPGEIIVSADHATILWRAGAYVIRDNGSTNGTYVNSEPITERELAEGDVIQFGVGGPKALFTAGEEYQTTFETRKSGSVPAPVDDAEEFSTRELVKIADSRARRRIRQVAVGTVLGGLLVIAGTLARQEYKDRRTAASLRDFASARIDTAAIRSMSRGVAFIVFAYGYVDRRSGEWLREARDSNGRRMFTDGPRGDSVPELVTGGKGPVVLEEGTATGFLVDTTGILITNRHVAEPWHDDPELPILRIRGRDVVGRFYSLRAFFPPGRQSFSLNVGNVSTTADLAVLRVTQGPVHVPALSLAARGTSAAQGEHVVYIGYPAGARNLLFRVPEAVSGQILGKAGDNERALVAELGRRGLIEPLILDGMISDVTVIDLVHNIQTAAGSSGGPLISDHRQVVAVHYAAVTPLAGEPFSTQRAVPVAQLWPLIENR
jgi:S1-C subfamily serine protease